MMISVRDNSLLFFHEKLPVCAGAADICGSYILIRSLFSYGSFFRIYFIKIFSAMQEPFSFVCLKIFSGLLFAAWGAVGILAESFLICHSKKYPAQSVKITRWIIWSKGDERKNIKRAVKKGRNVIQ